MTKDNNTVVISSEWKMSFELVKQSDGSEELVQIREQITRFRPSTYYILKNELLPHLACIVPTALYLRGELKDLPYINFAIGGLFAALATKCGLSNYPVECATLLACGCELAFNSLSEVLKPLVSIEVVMCAAAMVMVHEGARCIQASSWPKMDSKMLLLSSVSGLAIPACLQKMYGGTVNPESLEVLYGLFAVSSLAAYSFTSEDDIIPSHTTRVVRNAANLKQKTV